MTTNPPPTRPAYEDDARAAKTGTARASVR